MIKIIFLALLFVVCAVTEDAKIEPSLSGSRNQEYFGSGADRGKIYKEKDLEFTDAENRIIQDVFSPDYYEPNIILDYRYLKSGGRGYARSDGGQILILPQRYQMPPPQNNYDTLLEYLRLKHLEQISKPFMPNSRLRENYGEFDEGILRDNDRDNMRDNMREMIGGLMRQSVGVDNREDTRGDNRGDTRADPRTAIRGDPRVDTRADPRGAIRGDPRVDTRADPRVDTRADPRGAIRGDPRVDTRADPRGAIRGDPRVDTRADPRVAARGDPRVDMRADPRGAIRGDPRVDTRSDPRTYNRRDTGYRNEKLDRHDIEDKFGSDAELGSALYNH